MNEAQLRERIHQLVIDGKLPPRRTARVQARYGDGTACTACEVRLRASDIAYMMTCGAGAGAPVVVMHAHCFELWESERARPPAA